MYLAHIFFFAFASHKFKVEKMPKAEAYYPRCKVLEHGPRESAFLLYVP